MAMSLLRVAGGSANDRRFAILGQRFSYRIIASMTGLRTDTAMNEVEEIFDIVDEHDVVVGQRTRADVHRLGLRHRSVHLLVFDSNARVFLQKRSMSKDENPGQWDSSVAGHVDSGETYDACVVREAAEEIGLKLAVAPERLFKFDADIDTGMEFCWIYHTVAAGPFVLNEDEIEQARWFDCAELDRRLSGENPIYTPALAKIWSRYRGLTRD